MPGTADIDRSSFQDLRLAKGAGTYDIIITSRQQRLHVTKLSNQRPGVGGWVWLRLYSARSGQGVFGADGWVWIELHAVFGFETLAFVGITFCILHHCEN